MSDKTNLTISFTCNDLESYDIVSKLIIECLPDIQNLEHKRSDRKSEVNEELYYVGTMDFYIDRSVLMETFIQLDHLKSGYANEYIPDLCDDITVDIIFDNPDAQESQLASYLLNRNQELDHSVRDLDDEVGELRECLLILNDNMAQLNEKQISMYSYLHEYINLNKIAKIALETAHKFDPSILEQHEDIVTLQ